MILICILTRLTQIFQKLFLKNQRCTSVFILQHSTSLLKIQNIKLLIHGGSVANLR